MSTPITIQGDLDTMPASTRAALAALFGGSSSTTVVNNTGGTTTTDDTPAASPPTTPVPVVDLYFPVSAGDAQFPSPENSRSVRLDGVIQGKPYLVDKAGTIYRLVPLAAPLVEGTQGGRGLTINGRELVTTWGPDNAFNAMVVRQGDVFIQLAGGQWQHFDPAMGNTYNASLPDAATSTSTSTGSPTSSAPVAAPSPPAAYAIPPGSSGRVLTAAPGQIAAVLATAQDGDTLALDGVYAEHVPAIAVSLRVTLTSATSLDFATQELAYGKGGFVPLRDFEITGPGVITGAGINEGSAGGTAAIRPGASCICTVGGGITLRGNQNGVSVGGFPAVMNIKDAYFDHNGLGDSRTHDIYVSDGGTFLHIDGMTALNPNAGHAVKSRALVTTINNAHLAADECTVVDICDGAAVQATISNSLLIKPVGAPNHGIVGFGMESLKNGNAGLLITNSTINAQCDNPLLQGAAGSTITLSGITYQGTKPVASGATVAGL